MCDVHYDVWQCGNKNVQVLKARQRVVFWVNNLSKEDKFTDINFSLKKGWELLGIAGYMLGSGHCRTPAGTGQAGRQAEADMMLVKSSCLAKR